MTRTFVGGIWDGKRHAIPDAETHIRAPRLSGPRIEYDEYRLVRIAGGGREFGVFADSTLDDADVLELLIDHYAPPEDETGGD